MDNVRIVWAKSQMSGYTLHAAGTLNIKLSNSKSVKRYNTRRTFRRTDLFCIMTTAMFFFNPPALVFLVKMCVCV